MVGGLHTQWYISMAKYLTTEYVNRLLQSVWYDDLKDELLIIWSNGEYTIFNFWLLGIDSFYHNRQ